MTNAAVLDLTKLAADLTRAAADVEKETDKVLAEAANAIIVIMNRRVPVDTGRLKASLTVQAYPGKYIVGPVGVPYAVYVEFGTTRMRAQPFVRDSVQEYLDQLGAKVADVGVQMVMGRGL